MAILNFLELRSKSRTQSPGYGLKSFSRGYLKNTLSLLKMSIPVILRYFEIISRKFSQCNGPECFCV
ncbi:hypothetical protein BWD13_13330 [Leptospira santarosai serovar Grippotyphosa]|uniref:Uncharacterized protein n=1 Tax=Leptospira santarosai TaxID=28183 RepID=A0AB73LPD3_9LEPT|nr:hypothetical protein BWD13_13330 [Leptospira santarosai serovar Grippotyphosa]ONF94318.1 hypothetical protein BWD14_03350 [Leptospira santarosai]